MDGVKILSLDIATATGWKTRTASGTWNFKPKRGESSSMRIIRFVAKVKEMIKLEEITLVAYELPAGQHKSSIMVASEMIGALKVICEELGVDYAHYSASEIKKFATGKGNANKQAMIDSAIALGYNPIDDNEADAIHLYRLVDEELN